MIDLNFKNLPEKIFFNGKEWTGKIGFINGYNGYNYSKDDSLMCAVVNDSLFGKGAIPNSLTDVNGNMFQSTNRRGQVI